MKPDVYLYGMTCLSTIHVLDGDYPPPDSYREINRSYVIPSGEAGNAAVLLAGFGLRVKLAGPVLGIKTRDPILDFYRSRGVDCTGMEYDSDFPGVEDLVLVDARHRTIFGRFAHYHGSGENRWSQPDREAIGSAKAVSLDPPFGDASRRTAQLCAEAAVPYVTIDLRPDDVIHQHAAVSIISHEFLQREYPGADQRGLFAAYTAATAGLVMFTFGAREILYGRAGQAPRFFTPYTIAAKGSLAAGDFFRGGSVYALSQRWPDEQIVAVSAAVGALACVNFPAALNPPRLADVLTLAGIAS